MKLYLRNTLHGLIPLYPSDYEEKKKLRIGADYLANITSPRNLGFHKKFFALLNLGFSNQDIYPEFEYYRIVKTMECGYFKTIITERGKELYLPESINFASMDNDTFETLYNTMVQKLITDLRISAEDIEAEIINFI